MTSLTVQADPPRTPPKAAPPPRLPADVRACLIPGERIVLAVKPGVASIVLRRPLVFAAIVLATAALVWLGFQYWFPWNAFEGLVLGLAAFAIAAFWGHLDWVMRDYVLTDRRAVSASGVFRRLTVDSPLEVIQQVVIYRSLRERLFALGTIGLSTPADAGAPSVVWSMVARADSLVAQVRLHMARAGVVPTFSARREPAPPVPPAPPPASRPAAPRAQQSAMPFRPHAAANAATIPVIGLAGGIGAGKSTVAGILARLGCLVVDSDARAKVALDRPDVRNQLVQWWGDRVLGPPGPGGEPRVDRAKVARIVFSDPAERARLESLVHPIVRQDRTAAAREGAAAGARAVIVDAPLLFEAGIDAECDAVIFVDAPRAQRLQRVRSTRGWTEAELERREAAQLPLQTKRSRADVMVANDGSIADLEARVARALDQALAHARAGQTPA